MPPAQVASSRWRAPPRRPPEVLAWMPLGCHPNPTGSQLEVTLAATPAGGAPLAGVLKYKGYADESAEPESADGPATAFELGSTRGCGDGKQMR